LPFGHRRPPGPVWCHRSRKAFVNYLRASLPQQADPGGSAEDLENWKIAVANVGFGSMLSIKSAAWLAWSPLQLGGRRYRKNRPRGSMPSS
jgi:hypothetical protein